MRVIYTSVIFIITTALLISKQVGHGVLDTFNSINNINNEIVDIRWVSGSNNRETCILKRTTNGMIIRLDNYSHEDLENIDDPTFTLEIGGNDDYINLQELQNSFVELVATNNIDKHLSIEMIIEDIKGNRGAISPEDIRGINWGNRWDHYSLSIKPNTKDSVVLNFSSDEDYPGGYDAVDWGCWSAAECPSVDHTVDITKISKVNFIINRGGKEFEEYLSGDIIFHHFSIGEVSAVITNNGAIDKFNSSNSTILNWTSSTNITSQGRQYLLQRTTNGMVIHLDSAAQEETNIDPSFTLKIGDNDDYVNLLNNAEVKLQATNNTNSYISIEIIIEDIHGARGVIMPEKKDSIKWNNRWDHYSLDISPNTRDSVVLNFSSDENYPGGYDAVDWGCWSAAECPNVDHTVDITKISKVNFIINRGGIDFDQYLSGDIIFHHFSIGDENEILTNIDDVYELNEVFPNPFNDVLHIVSLFPKKVQILDSRGQVLLSTKILNDSADIDTNLLPIGVYILELIDQKGVQRSKIIKN